MLIILEGPDGAGKTTLAQTLTQLISSRVTGIVEVIHSGVPTQHPLDEYVCRITHYRPGRFQHVILDRWHLGEWVYPKLRERKTLLDPPAWWAIEAYLARLGAVVVRCQQYTDEYAGVYASRGEALTQVAELPFADKLFDEVANLTVLPTVSFNFRSVVNGDPHAIFRLAHEREQAVSHLADFTTYAGPLRPRVLLFGDVRHGYRPYDPSFGGARNLHEDDPAFLPFLNTSGHWLRRALADYPSFAVANACDVDDPAALYGALGEPRVVTLGRNAQRRLNDLGIPHGSAPHPQFARRFHTTKLESYAHAVERAAATGEDYSSWPN